MEGQNSARPDYLLVVPGVEIYFYDLQERPRRLAPRLKAGDSSSPSDARARLVSVEDCG
jgi:hypothetical protein